MLQRIDWYCSSDLLLEAALSDGRVRSVLTVHLSEIFISGAHVAAPLCTVQYIRPFNVLYSITLRELTDTILDVLAARYMSLAPRL